MTSSQPSSRPRKPCLDERELGEELAVDAPKSRLKSAPAWPRYGTSTCLGGEVLAAQHVAPRAAHDLGHHRPAEWPRAWWMSTPVVKTRSNERSRKGSSRAAAETAFTPGRALADVAPGRPRSRRRRRRARRERSRPIQRRFAPTLQPTSSTVGDLGARPAARARTVARPRRPPRCAPRTRRRTRPPTAPRAGAAGTRARRSSARHSTHDRTGMPLRAEIVLRFERRLLGEVEHARRRDGRRPASRSASAMSS